jgi:hypothetical protein
MQDIYIFLVIAVRQSYMTSTHIYLYVMGPGSIPSWHPFGDLSSSGSFEVIGAGLGNCNMYIFQLTVCPN